MATALHSDVLLGKVRKALDGRRLIWFGTRGEDGEALLRLPELEASFAVTAPLRSARIPAEANVTLEHLAGARPDLDQHDIDLDVSEAAEEFRRRLLREVSTRCVVVTYRPAHIVSAMAFSMTETMTLAGLFKDRQLAFEHKPWVETALARHDVRTLGWRYFADEHRWSVRRLATTGPIVLRANRASGGVGIVRIENGAQVETHWPADAEGFVGVAPFLDGATPLNLSGCVFRDGSVHLHPPSVQLIGLPDCTERPFGYCGNDFAAVAALSPGALDELDAMGRTVGAWLHSERYVGAFGIDALCTDDHVHFTEVNPRFQGSSALSADVAQQMEVPDLFLEHVAASLGVDPQGPGLTVREWVARQPGCSHIVVHNTSLAVATRLPDIRLPTVPAGTRLTQLLPTDVAALPGAALCRIATPGSVTTTGFELDGASSALVSDLSACFGGQSVTKRKEPPRVAQRR